jgi:hypothetical protein
MSDFFHPFAVKLFYLEIATIGAMFVYALICLFINLYKKLRTVIK